MHTTPIQAPCPAAEPTRLGPLQWLVALYSRPALRGLDPALLRDIGATEELREQAELREAWRHWLPPDGLFRNL